MPPVLVEPPPVSFHASCRRDSFRFLPSFLRCSLPAFSSAVVLRSSLLVSSSMEDKKRAQKQARAILLEPPGREREGGGRTDGRTEKRRLFSKKCAHFGGVRRRLRWVHGCRETCLFFWKHRRARGSRAAVAIRAEGSGGSAPPLPGNRAPSPACGSALVPATREPLLVLSPLFVQFCAGFDTCHIQGGGLRRILMCVCV